MSKYQFRQIFRITRECFDELCQTIISSVDENQFNSQHYIDAVLSHDSKSMYKSNCATSGGFISNEVKLAIVIRMLAGGGSLDLAAIFDVDPIHIHTILMRYLNIRSLIAILVKSTSLTTSLTRVQWLKLAMNFLSVLMVF